MHGAESTLTMNVAPTAIARSVGHWFMPVIYYPNRADPSTRFRRFPRKTKPSSVDAALRYARCVIHYRTVRENEKRRHLAVISHPRFGGAR